MITALHKYAKFFYLPLVIIIGLIIFSFIFMYAVPVGDQSGPPAITVADVNITSQEFWRAYERALAIYREVYENFSEDQEKQLKQTVINSLINEQVGLVAAKAAGFSVTDLELQDAITSNPAFGGPLAFNKALYLKTLSVNRLTVQAYETSKRSELLMVKIKNLIDESVGLTAAEFKGLEEYLEGNEELKKTLLQRKQSLAYESYMSGLRRQVRIKVDPSITE